MEYQKVISLLDNTQNQPTAFRTKSWVGINDGSHRAHNTDSQITFKISMVSLSLCNYREAYILVNGTLIVQNTGTAAAHSNRNKR